MKESVIGPPAPSPTETASRQLPRERPIRVAGRGPEGWAKQVDAWRALGASYLIAEPRNGGLKLRDGHLDVLRTFRETVRS
jgi:hypothetical protein